MCLTLVLTVKQHYIFFFFLACLSAFTIMDFKAGRDHEIILSVFLNYLCAKNFLQYYSIYIQLLASSLQLGPKAAVPSQSWRRDQRFSSLHRNRGQDSSGEGGELQMLQGQDQDSGPFPCSCPCALTHIMAHSLVRSCIPPVCKNVPKSLVWCPRGQSGSASWCCGCLLSWPLSFVVKTTQLLFEKWKPPTFQWWHKNFNFPCLRSLCCFFKLF